VIVPLKPFAPAKVRNVDPEPPGLAMVMVVGFAETLNDEAGVTVSPVLPEEAE
jgi:hypothetical protein